MSDTPAPRISAGTLESIERYVVEGDAALRDPVVAAAVSAYPGLVAEVARAMEVLRQPLTPRRVEIEHTRLLATEHTVAMPREAGRAWLGSRVTTTRSRAWRIGVSGMVVAAAVAGFAVLTRSTTTSSRWMAPARVYATTVGQRASLQLADGTRVTLAPRTTLRVPRFGADARTVVLDGEAYFEVGRASGAPFVVRTRESTTRVLGTAFVVRRYPDDARTRVAVTDGKVEVRSAGVRQAQVVVPAGRVAEITDSTAVTSSDDAAQSAAWVRGELVFRSAPSKAVFAALGRWYGYEFRLADSSLAHRTLTAGFSTESSREALATLQALLDVDMTFDGSVVTLTPRRAVRAPAGGREDVRRTLTPQQREAGR